MQIANDRADLCDGLEAGNAILQDEQGQNIPDLAEAWTGSSFTM